MLEQDSIPDDAKPLNNGLIAELTVLDRELDAARQQYCECSGKPLCKIDAETVHNLVTIHGRETALKILRTQQRQVSLEWIWLNDKGLSNLALHQPAEYFVYAASKLLQDCTIHSELIRLHEAAEAWRKLQQWDETILHPINELIRRLLANYDRKKLNSKLIKFKCKKINQIADSHENIMQFQHELTELIQKLIAAKKRDDVIARGITSFRLQGMITHLSQLEIEVGRELTDFDLIDGKSTETTEMLTGRQYASDAVKQKAKKAIQRENRIAKEIKYTNKPVVKTGGFKLNIGKSK